MKYMHQIAAVPNAIINDTVIHFTTKRVAVAMLFMTTRKTRTVIATVRDIAAASACSPATVQQAVQELVHRGYLVKERLYRYSDGLKRIVYGANRYVWAKPQGGYTLVKREILSYRLTPSAFSVLLFLYRCAGRKGRAWPSLRHIAGLLKDISKTGLDMAKATVCRAVEALRGAMAVIRCLCSTLDGDYANNSYFPTDMVRPAPPKNFSHNGVVSNLTSIYDFKQITGDHKLGDRNSGVAQFGTLYNFDRSEPSHRLFDRWDRPGRFDGTGIMLSVTGELADLM